MPPRLSIDAFTLPGYETPDAIPASAETNDREVVETYKIPPAVWMIFFLVSGYLGLRLIMED